MHRINTALCSFGMSGSVFHAPFIQANPGFNLTGVWERSQKRASTIYPDIRSYDSLESLLTDEDIDLVIVNTPNYTHFDFARKALLAGKHVLVEKSFTVTVSEARELILLAKACNKQLAVFQNRRYDSDFKTVQKIISEAVLGDLIDAEFHFSRFKPALSPKKHKEDDIPGAGLLHDLGPHLIDQALTLFGFPVSLFGYQKITRPDSLVNDFFDIILFYPAFTVRLKSGLLIRQSTADYILHGSKGTFTKTRADIQEDILKSGQIPGSFGWGIEQDSAKGVLEILENGTCTKSFIPALPGNYMEFYDDLYASIVHGKRLPISGEDGLNVMLIIEAVLKSDETKKVVFI